MKADPGAADIGPHLQLSPLPDKVQCSGLETFLGPGLAEEKRYLPLQLSQFQAPKVFHDPMPQFLYSHVRVAMRVGWIQLSPDSEVCWVWTCGEKGLTLGKGQGKVFLSLTYFPCLWYWWRLRLRTTTTFSEPEE